MADCRDTSLKSWDDSIGQHLSVLRSGGNASSGESASAKYYCTKLQCVRKRLIVNEIVVEAAGVELFSVLTARKLLIPGTATTAKKASLPDPLYVYCTKILALGKLHTLPTVSHSNHRAEFCAQSTLSFSIASSPSAQRCTMSFEAPEEAPAPGFENIPGA